MTPQLEPLYSRSFDVLCELGRLALSGTDALLHCQIDHSRKLLALGGDRLRASLAVSPEAWTTAAALDEAVESARQLTVAASKWQAETMRQIETQAAMAQAIVADAMADNFADRAGPRAGRGRKAEHRLAA